MEAVLGETTITVTEEKVSIVELQAQVISGLTLSLHASPGNSHTIVAKTTAQHLLKYPKQVSDPIVGKVECTYSIIYNIVLSMNRKESVISKSNFNLGAGVLYKYVFLSRCYH